MKNVLSIKVDKSLVQALKEFCRSRGLKQGFFVEKAIKSQLEREELLEDMLDLQELRPQEKASIPFSDYLGKRKK